jgi:hypothetical protein
MLFPLPKQAQVLVMMGDCRLISLSKLTPRLCIEVDEVKNHKQTWTEIFSSCIVLPTTIGIPQMQGIWCIGLHMIGMQCIHDPVGIFIDKNELILKAKSSVSFSAQDTNKEQLDMGHYSLVKYLHASLLS